MANSYRRRNRNNTWMVVLICLVGLVIGGYLGFYLSQWEIFSWVGIALQVGAENPWVIMSPLLDASILLKVRFNLGSLLGLIIAYIVYRLVRR